MLAVPPLSERPQQQPETDSKPDHAADPPPAVKNEATMRASLMSAPPNIAANNTPMTLSASGIGIQTPIDAAAENRFDSATPAPVNHAGGSSTGMTENTLSNTAWSAVRNH